MNFLEKSYLLAICAFLLCWGQLDEIRATTQRYRLIWSEEPTTTAVIGWEKVSGKGQKVFLGTTDHGPDTSKYPIQIRPYKTIEFRGMVNQFARLSNLKPNTAYYLLVADNEGVSRRFWFVTAPNNSNKRLSLVAGGDSRNNREPRIIANYLVAKLRPHAVLFGGDMTDDDTAKEWREWFDDWQKTIGIDGRMIPIIPARGNHERSSKTLRHLFDVPAYFASNLGGDLLRLYSLNTEISISGNQTDWLEEDLRQNCGKTWLMAQYHKPIRPHVSRKAEGRSQYDLWAPLFYRYHFGLVVECDAHTVKTTWPIRPSREAGNDEGFVRDNEFGTVYVGEGCWGAPLRENDDKKSWTRASASFNQFKWIFVGKDKIEVRTVMVEDENSLRKIGVVLDSDRFKPPVNLKLWQPRTGEVVEIFPPSLQITITEPASGLHFPRLPQTLELKADAADFFSVVKKVDFLANGTRVLVDQRAPFQVDWNLTQPGRFEFQAVAYDNKGNARYSCPVVITADQNLLPKEWQNFQVEKQQDAVSITWATKPQRPHLQYQVERAGTDQNFEPIAIFSFSNSPKTYLHFDNKPLPGLSYYRIRALRDNQLDEFSNTLEIRMPGESTSNFKVYPSPVGQERALSVEFFSVDDEQVELFLFNSSGRPVLHLDKSMKKGKNWFQIHPGPITGGIYYLKARTKGKMVVKKVVFK